ncbi:MAG TPA: homogentisate 1,2-dioxygenase [Phenylobacterium sp.]|jgi:hypothetical protein|uniref:homogentisate 1,2-dioxygenase n=1 Tax=Phenylobacterium sp. TaxID=1871053 RepID=UPI002D732D70|nr:homogentisate 1,2-dioxygenase [Phenylobacterium sp.]HZZ69846.1 homogentisate 1,2-dioxygenase [Phenylobacterium sp.]
MRGVAVVMTAAVALALVPAIGAAQEAPPSAVACAAMDKTLPPELAAWTAQTPQAAATSAAGLRKASLTPGKAVTADLPQTPQVHFVTQPEKPGGTVSHGGMFELNIDKAGTYVVALGSGAWIDVLKDGKPLMSTAHGRGPTCSTLRKMVDFPLQPGRYVLQVSANADARLPILLARRP